MNNNAIKSVTFDKGCYEIDSDDLRASFGYLMHGNGEDGSCFVVVR